MRTVNVTNTMLGPLNVHGISATIGTKRHQAYPLLIRTSEVASYDTVVRRFSEIKLDSSLNEKVFSSMTFKSVRCGFAGA